MNQSIFDKTTTHLLRQGPTEEHSHPFVGSTFLGTKAKRYGTGGNGEKCALCFISQLCEVSDYTKIHKAMPEDLPAALYICHDYVPQERWPGVMRGIARWFGLSELSIDIWESEQAPHTDYTPVKGPLVNLQEK